jgi:hypothetical protein
MMVTRDDDQRDAPTGAGDDSLQEEALRSVIPDGPAGVLLRTFVEAANSEGEDAQAVYEAALEALRQAPEQVAVGIARALGSCPDEDYTLKWTLVHAAAELKDAAVLPLLHELVTTPIPPEVSADPHSYSSVEDETVLRTTAVDGVSEIAARGDERAEGMLFEFLEVPSISIRRAAVQGLLQSPRGEELRARVAEYLPRDQRFLLELKATRVEDMEQVRDPQRYLSERGRAEPTEQPPAEFGDSRPGEKGPEVQRPISESKTTRRRRAEGDKPQS